MKKLVGNIRHLTLQAPDFSHGKADPFTVRPSPASDELAKG